MTIDKIAWLELANGQILSTRSKGKTVYYLPGGKREPGESDIDTLVREINEELAVKIAPETATHEGTFTAQAHGHPEGVAVQLICYSAHHEGTPTASSEIAEVRWLQYKDRPLVSPVDQLIFDHLHKTGRLK